MRERALSAYAGEREDEFFVFHARVLAKRPLAWRSTLMHAVSS